MAFLGVYSMKEIIVIIFSTYFLKVVIALLDKAFVYMATSWKNNGKVNEE